MHLLLWVFFFLSFFCLIFQQIPFGPMSLLLHMFQATTTATSNSKQRRYAGLTERPRSVLPTYIKVEGIDDSVYQKLTSIRELHIGYSLIYQYYYNRREKKNNIYLKLVAILTIQVAHLTSHIIGTISCADLGRTINLIIGKLIRTFFFPKLFSSFRAVKFIA